MHLVTLPMASLPDKVRRPLRRFLNQWLLGRRHAYRRLDEGMPTQQILDELQQSLLPDAIVAATALQAAHRLRHPNGRYRDHCRKQLQGPLPARMADEAAFLEQVAAVGEGRQPALHPLPAIKLYTEYGRLWADIRLSMPGAELSWAQSVPLEIPKAWRQQLIRYFTPVVHEGRVMSRPCVAHLAWDGGKLAIDVWLPRIRQAAAEQEPEIEEIEAGARFWDVTLPKAAAAAALIVGPALPAVAADYTVKAGDTLSSIARQHIGPHASWHAVYQANRDSLRNPDRIYPGMVLHVPESTAAVPAGGLIIRPGDTLFSLAQRHLGSGAKWTQLWQANKDHLRSPNLIYAGMPLRLPGEAPVAHEPAATPMHEVYHAPARPQHAHPTPHQPAAHPAPTHAAHHPAPAKPAAHHPAPAKPAHHPSTAKRPAVRPIAVKPPQLPAKPASRPAMQPLTPTMEPATPLTPTTLEPANTAPVTTAPANTAPANAMPPQPAEPGLAPSQPTAPAMEPMPPTAPVTEPMQPPAEPGAPTMVAPTEPLAPAEPLTPATTGSEPASPPATPLVPATSGAAVSTPQTQAPVEPVNHQLSTPLSTPIVQHVPQTTAKPTPKPAIRPLPQAAKPPAKPAPMKTQAKKPTTAHAPAKPPAKPATTAHAPAKPPAKPTTVAHTPAKPPVTPPAKPLTVLQPINATAPEPQAVPPTEPVLTEVPAPTAPEPAAVSDVVSQAAPTVMPDQPSGIPTGSGVLRPPTMARPFAAPFRTHLSLLYNPLSYREDLATQDLQAAGSITQAIGGEVGWRLADPVELAGSYVFNSYRLDREGGEVSTRSENHGRLMGYYVLPLNQNLELGFGAGAQLSTYATTGSTMAGGRTADLFDASYQRVMLQTEAKVGYQPVRDLPLTLTAGAGVMPWGTVMQSSPMLPTQLWGFTYTAGARYSIMGVAVEARYMGQQIMGDQYQQGNDMLRVGIGYEFR